MGAIAASRPVVLAVINQLPWPLDRGGRIRSYHLLRELARRFHVRLLGGVEGPDTDAAVAALRRVGVDVLGMSLVPRTLWGEALRAGAAAVRGEPFILYRRHYRRNRRRALQAALRDERPDVVYLDHLSSLVLGPRRMGVPYVLDQNSVCSLLVRRAAAEAPRGIRAYVRYQARLLARMERRAARGVDLVLGVSEDEARYFAACGARTCLVPNGVDCAAYDDLPIAARPGPPLLLFVGDMSWAPNVAAAARLARVVLPAVRVRHGAARLRIVGREPTPAVRALAMLPHVEVTGRVPDVRPHLAAAHVLAVPLAAGGGTRLKILEAFAAGLPVVSSAVGCEGLAVTPGLHLAVASDARFVPAVLDVLEQGGDAARRAEQGRTLVRSRYDWHTVGAEAATAIEGLVVGSRDWARGSGDGGRCR